jgi:hypothetical protein
MPGGLEDACRGTRKVLSQWYTLFFIERGSLVPPPMSSHASEMSVSSECALNGMPYFSMNEAH